MVFDAIEMAAGRGEICCRACDVIPMPDLGDSFDNALAEIVNGYYRSDQP
jgi:hypothetical protein